MFDAVSFSRFPLFIHLAVQCTFINSLTAYGVAKPIIPKRTNTHFMLTERNNKCNENIPFCVLCLEIRGHEDVV